MKALIYILLIASLFVSCGDDDDKFANAVTEHALVIENGWDGCEYLIKTDTGYYYYVKNMPNEFKSDDLRITIRYIKTEETLNCGFAGSQQIIEYSSIEAM